MNPIYPLVLGIGIGLVIGGLFALYAWCNGNRRGYEEGEKSAIVKATLVMNGIAAEKTVSLINPEQPGFKHSEP